MEWFNPLHQKLLYETPQGKINDCEKILFETSFWTDKDFGRAAWAPSLGSGRVGNRV